MVPRNRTRAGALVLRTVTRNKTRDDAKIKKCTLVLRTGGNRKRAGRMVGATRRYQER